MSSSLQALCKIDPDRRAAACAALAQRGRADLPAADEGIARSGDGGPDECEVRASSAEPGHAAAATGDEFSQAMIPQPRAESVLPRPPALAAFPNRYAISAREAAQTEHAAAYASLLIEPFGNSKRCQILFYAHSHPGLSIGGLSSLLACSVSVVSQYVSQLERQGWLQVVSVGRQRLVHVAGAERSRIILAMRTMSAGLSAADEAARC